MRRQWRMNITAKLSKSSDGAGRLPPLYLPKVFPTSVPALEFIKLIRKNPVTERRI